MNDLNPLRVSNNKIGILDEKRNTEEFLKGEFTLDRVNPEIKFLIHCKIVSLKAQEKIETPFGFIFCHAMTEKPIDENFNLIFNYNVNFTKTATYDRVIHRLNSMDIERKVLTPTPPLCMGFNIEKDLYRQMINMKDHVRRTLELDIDKPDNEKLEQGKKELMNFMGKLDFHLWAVAHSLTQGDRICSISKIIRQAPSIYYLSNNNNRSFIYTCIDRSRIANLVNSNILKFMNKMNPVPNSDRLRDIMSCFNVHTDNAASIKDLHGWISKDNDNTPLPFDKPDMVILTTQRLVEKLIEAGLVKTTKAHLNQIMTVISQENNSRMWETVALEPRTNYVNLRNGSYKCDETGQMIRHTQTSKDQELHYMNIGTKNIIVVNVDYNSSFSNLNINSDSDQIVRNAKLTTSTSFDYMLPTGVTMSDNVSGNPPGPCRQTTTFINEKGSRCTMGCYQIAKFLTEFFGDGKLGTFKFNHTGGYDRDTMEQSMIFYRARPDTSPATATNANSSDSTTSKTSGEGGESGLDDEKPKDKEDQLLYRNVYMTDNVFYTDEIHIQNIISILQNRTAPLLQTLIGDMHEEIKKTKQTQTKTPHNPLKRQAPLVEPSCSKIAKTSSSGGCGGGDSSSSRGGGDGASGIGGTDPGKGAIRVNTFHEPWVISRVTTYMARETLYTCSEDHIQAVSKMLYELKNKSAIEYLEYINMGFGVLWVKPEFVQADSMLLCRPAGFNHIDGALIPSPTDLPDPTTTTWSLDFNSQSTTSRLSMGTYPAIMYKNAALIENESQITTTNEVVDTTEQAEIAGAIRWLRVQGERQSGVITATPSPEKFGRAANAWWPVICQPVMNKSVFESANSPVGRRGTHHATPEAFDAEFNDTSVKDIEHTEMYTFNLAFGCMQTNINTIFLYNNNHSFLRDPHFPLFKYLNHNPLATASINAMQESMFRGPDAELNNMKRLETESVEPIDETKISHIMGAAIPKNCWSPANYDLSEDLKKANSNMLNPVITRNTSFFITGAFEKFDLDRRYFY